eukprot:2556058-Alexandrium_andersonii.AAC.1
MGSWRCPRPSRALRRTPRAKSPWTSSSCRWSKRAAPALPHSSPRGATRRAEKLSAPPCGTWPRRCSARFRSTLGA